MRTRRELLSKGGLLLLSLPAGLRLAGCGGPDAPAVCTRAGALVISGSDLTFTSSCEVSHTHDVTLVATEISAPPVAGVSRDTTVDKYDNHLHTVSLTAAELAQVQGGATVTKTTTTASDGHSHSFAFRKA